MQRLRQMWRQQLALLSEHIEELEARINTLIDQDPALSQRYRIMLSAPGMGPVLGCCG